MTNETTARERARLLGDAEAQYPLCGHCLRECDYDGDTFICRPCGIAYNTHTLEPEILEPEKPACGAPCEDPDHDRIITTQNLRISYETICNPCLLTKDHQTTDHAHGCYPRLITNQNTTPNTTNALAAENGETR